ncbi:MAG: dTDP-4-amino-4,6-dideoxygalactose transaminase [Planctomycetota bacterium]
MSRIPPESPVQAKVPFHVLSMVGNEQAYVDRVLASGALMGGGVHTRACEALLEHRLGAARVFLTHSCTGALELAAMLCGIKEGDEVLMPSLTSSSTANAFLRLGAVPVFVDVEPETLNLDPALAEAAVTDRCRAVVPIHYLGVAADLDGFTALANRRSLSLVEDAAQGLGARHGGRELGSVGRFGAFSFHQTKNLSAGEGGALVVRDPDDVPEAEVLLDKGTNRRAFFRGEVRRYEWLGPGSAFQPSELVAAFLHAQLEVLDEVTEGRRATFARYGRRLAPLGDAGLLRLPVVPDRCRTNAHGFHVLCADEAERDGLIAWLSRAGVDARTHFVPLHATPYGRRAGRAGSSMTVTEDAARRLLRLPLFHGMTETQVDLVAEAVLGFYGHDHG